MWQCKSVDLFCKQLVDHCRGLRVGLWLLLRIAYLKLLLLRNDSVHLAQERLQSNASYRVGFVGRSSCSKSVPCQRHFEFVSAYVCEDFTAYDMCSDHSVWIR